MGQEVLILRAFVAAIRDAGGMVGAGNEDHERLLGLARNEPDQRRIPTRAHHLLASKA
jgi:hypothetical protein